MDDLHRQTLLEGRSALMRTSDSIQRSQQTALETESIGTTVIEELDSQKEVLLKARERLVNTDYELSRTHNLLLLVRRNVIANKIILILIIFMEVIILFGIIYLKFIRN